MLETGAQRAKSTVNHARSQRVAPSSSPRLSCSTRNAVGSFLPGTRWALSRTDGKNPTRFMLTSSGIQNMWLQSFFAYSASLVWFALCKLLFSPLPTCSEMIWCKIWKLHCSKRIHFLKMIIKRLIRFQVSSCFTPQLIRVLYCWMVSQSIQSWTVCQQGWGWGRSTMCSDLFLLICCCFFKDSHRNDSGAKSPNFCSQAHRICFLDTYRQNLGLRGVAGSNHSESVVRPEFCIRKIMWT